MLSLISIEQKDKCYQIISLHGGKQKNISLNTVISQQNMC